MKFRYIFTTLLAGANFFASAEKASICNGVEWLDSKGNAIQAHGGGVLYHHGTYFWYGENKDGETRADGACGARVEAKGVSAYRSRDLIKWEPLGVVLSANNEIGHDLNPIGIIERPKVIFNRQTRKFVMWMHIDDKNYKLGKVGVAIADQPEGPFTYLGSLRPNNNDSRDMTLFQDDDGNAYLIHSSENNKTLHIVALSKDYLKVEGPSHRNFVDRSMEAPTLFKCNKKYYLIASGCSGWSPNAARSAVADALQGPWTELGNPCIGPDAELTFRSQGTFILPVQGKSDKFIFMADQWDMKNLGASKYLWLPIELRSDGTLRLEWQKNWDLSWFNHQRPDEPIFSLPSGSINSYTVDIEIKVQKNAIVYYTLNGKSPTINATRAGSKINVPSGLVLSAIAVIGDQVSPISKAAYYFLGSLPQLPKISLSDLTPIESKVGYGEITKNKNLDGKDIYMDKVQYKSGLVAHAPSELIYELDSSWQRFVAIGGINDTVGTKGSIQMEVYIDDDLVAQSPILRGNNIRSWHFDIIIPKNSKRLRLISHTTPDGYGYDHATWANAGFIF